MLRLNIQSNSEQAKTASGRVLQMLLDATGALFTNDIARRLGWDDRAGSSRTLRVLRGLEAMRLIVKKEQGDHGTSWLHASKSGTRTKLPSGVMMKFDRGLIELSVEKADGTKRARYLPERSATPEQIEAAERRVLELAKL